MSHDTTNPSINNLKNINQSLAKTLLTGDHTPNTLTKKTELLDRVFTAVINEQVAPKRLPAKPTHPKTPANTASATPKS